MKNSDISGLRTKTFGYREKEEDNPLSFKTGCQELLEKKYLCDTVQMSPSPL